MKFWLVALLGVALGGCQTHKVNAGREKLTDSCSIVAEQRAQDGALNGYDEQLQTLVFRNTYADCVQWNAAHSITK
jgi:hypothetical protein